MTTKPDQTCPCGSGKVYQECHGRSLAAQRAEAPRFAAYTVDRENDSNLIISDLVVVNQLRREVPKIAASFDEHYMSEFREISIEMSKIWAILMIGFQSPNNLTETEKIHFPLLLNSWQSITASLDLLRDGFTLQPGILLRNALETISTVLYLLQNPRASARFRKGKLQSQSTITTAKKIIPDFGRLYGAFSEWFAHIGKVHTWIHETLPYQPANRAVITNLAFIRTVVWLHLVACEVTFLRFIGKPRYWSKRTEGDFLHDPSEQELKWLRTFLRELPGDTEGHA